jgi:RNA polymerase-binding transcription factor DksA
MGATRPQETLEAFARRTLLARQGLLRSRVRANEQVANELLEEREPEWQDRAARVSSATALESLAGDERIELEHVDAALARLDDGTWGWCLTCGGPIPAARLRAVPEATRCTGCSNHYD